MKPAEPRVAGEAGVSTAEPRVAGEAGVSNVGLRFPCEVAYGLA